MRIQTILRRLAAASLLFSAACGGDDGGNNETPTLEIAIADGDGQSATVGAALLAYSVTVTDLNGTPQSGATVTWSVTAGGGTVTPATSTTDGNGEATAIATLGTTAGTQVVRAVAGGDQVQFSSTGEADVAAALETLSGDGQRALKGTTVPVAATVMDQYGNPVAGATVEWVAAAGNGTPATPMSVSDATGKAQVAWTLAAAAGGMTIKARLAGVDSVTFRATAAGTFAVLGGGNNVEERRTSDLWVADGYGYTGTWGVSSPIGAAVKIWQLDGVGSPVLKDSIILPNTTTVSDIEVSPDGKWLIFTGENGLNRGVHAYELTAPGTAVFRAKNTTLSLHTGALSVIGGKLYAFTAKNAANCALVIYDLSTAATGTIASVSSTPIPDNYCIHDTFVRDGYAFVFAWDEGLYIFDVGNGSHGGSPQNPVQISKTGGFGGQTHNGWWFWNPNGEKKYLFIGEEGPGAVGATSSGDIHVVDVSNLAAPVQVGTYSMGTAGVHNFWMDEAKQILYAAYYNGGVVALDVSGTLTGSLSNREIAAIRPGGQGNTYVWGVMLYNNSLYASDMVSGFWQLGLP